VTSISLQSGKIISGSKDGKVAITSLNGGSYKLEKVFELGAATQTVPKSIDFFNDNILVGLRNGSILEFKNVFEEDAESRSKVLMQSHFEGEVWGLVVVDDQRVVTCGDDNRIMMFDLTTRKCT